MEDVVDCCWAASSRGREIMEGMRKRDISWDCARVLRGCRASR